VGEPAAAFSFKATTRFADNLYRARERAGLTQKNATARAAVTRTRLGKIEDRNGSRTPGWLST